MSTLPIEMTAPATAYRQRRAKLGAALQRPLLLLAGQARARNYAAHTYPFRAGSHYLYFGGPPIEGAAWIIDPGCDGESGCVLLRTPRTLDDAVWFGEGASDAAIAAAAGVPESALESPNHLSKLLFDRQGAYLAPPCAISDRWMAEMKIVRADPDEHRAIIALRLSKDEHELAAMRRAAKVGVDAHLAGMRACKPGRREADVVAAMLSVYVANRCDVSFTPIVSIRGDILHSETYGNTLEAGRMLLVDSGGEEPTGYASDITRTYPVTGKWDVLQRQLYEVLLRSQQAAVAACVPGRRYRDIHDLAAQVTCAGLVEAGLLKGRAEELAERRAHTLFFTHGLGHLIGLDVHDMEDLGDLAGYAPGRTRRPGFGDKFLRLDRDLEPGLALTIEPGLYLVPAIWQSEAMIAPFKDVVHRPLVDQLLAAHFGGIRIEDTVVVRGGGASGPEVLTAALPKSPDELSAIVGQG